MGISVAIIARDEARRWGLTNARFELRDVADLDGAGSFDLVTAFDAIHDQAHPATVLANVHTALKRALALRDDRARGEEEREEGDEHRGSPGREASASRRPRLWPWCTAHRARCRQERRPERRRARR